jgi:endo-1,4-beta-D-glucanase Y
MLRKAAVERKAYIMEFLLDCLQETADKISFIDVVSVPLPYNISANYSHAKFPRSGELDAESNLFCFLSSDEGMFYSLSGPKYRFGKNFTFGCAGELEKTARELSKEMLFSQNFRGEIIWHVVARQGKLDELQAIWEWAKVNLTREELKNNLLFAKDFFGNTAWQLAAKVGELDIMQKIWEWAKENLTTEEINNKLLLATDNMSRTTWHVAAYGGKLDVLQKIWEWAKEDLATEEIRNELLLATDSNGQTTWHVAAEVGKLDIMQKIWDWTKEKTKKRADKK